MRAPSPNPRNTAWISPVRAGEADGAASPELTKLISLFYSNSDFTELGMFLATEAVVIATLATLIFIGVR